MSLTKQEIAKGIYDWFIVNGNPRSTDGRTCRYRGPTNNHRCAVGCILPDDLYKPEMEEKQISRIMINQDSCFEPSIRDYFGIENLEFLSHCQSWHDNKGQMLPKNILKQIFVSFGIDVSRMTLLD